MPLPADDSHDLVWPPVEWRDVFARYREHAAWYSGNPNALSTVYYAGGGKEAAFWRTDFDRFWARTPAPQTRLMIHVPIAAALATVSADLLFGEAPDFVIPKEDAEGKAQDPNGKIQDRLTELVEIEAIMRTLSGLAETVAALGGGYLRVVWDDSIVKDHPMLSAVDADCAIPEFVWGRLQAVTFFTIVKQEQPQIAGAGVSPSAPREVWRLLERHSPGKIEYGLYMGDPDHLGLRQPFETLPDLGIGVKETIETQLDSLTAVYIPNIRPNRVFRGSELGRSDYDGIEASMDALDEAATSLQRDLRLARARLIVPQELIENRAKGQGGVFDLDQEVWEAAPFGMPNMTPDKLITPSQFAIRATDHLAVIRAKIEEIIVSAGYSSASFGYENGSQAAATATEIVNRERQSFLTRSKKVEYWIEPLEEILYAFLQADERHFNGPGALRPKVQFADSVHEDLHENATIAQILAASKSASTETRVRIVHPKWTDEQVTKEIGKIDKEGQTSGRTGPTGEANPGMENGANPPAPAATRLGDYGPGRERVAAGRMPPGMGGSPPGEERGAAAGAAQT